jgi:hypothetical protein
MTTARNLQRMIHVGCKQLGLDDDTRHDLQLVATGKASMADMSDAELKRVIDALKARGFKPFGNRREGGLKGAYKPTAPRADLRFIHVLWGMLGAVDAVRVPGRDGLNAFIRARFEGKWKSVPIDVDTLRDAGQINDVTRALKDMCRRAGVQVK